MSAACVTIAMHCDIRLCYCVIDKQLTSLLSQPSYIFHSQLQLRCAICDVTLTSLTHHTPDLLKPQSFTSPTAQTDTPLEIHASPPPFHKGNVNFKNRRMGGFIFFIIPIVNSCSFTSLNRSCSFRQIPPFVHILNYNRSFTSDPPFYHSQL